MLSMVLSRAGRGEEALDRIKTALRLNPFPPDWSLGVIAVAYRSLGRFEEVIEAHKPIFPRWSDGQVRTAGSFPS